MNNLDDWIYNLRKYKKPIIVEGKKDKQALSSFGIKNIFILNKPLFQIVELIADITDECLLLLDLDKEGKKIYSYLKKNLQRHGIKIDSKYREFLFKNTKLRNIEGLKNYIKVL